MMGMFDEIIVSNAKDYLVPGVVAVVDETTKTAYVDYYDNALKGVFSLVTRVLEDDIGSLRHTERFIDFSNLKVKVLKIGTEIDYHISFRLIVEDLIKQGWHICNITNVPRVKVNLKYRRIDAERRYYVVLQSMRGTQIVVGVFKLLALAEQFIKDHYSTESVTHKVIADNELTKNFIEKYNGKMPTARAKNNHRLARKASGLANG